MRDDHRRGRQFQPSSYIGTYGFDGSSRMFDHHTLFLGYDPSVVSVTW